MSVHVFDQLKERLPEYDHVNGDYRTVPTPEHMIDSIEQLAQDLYASGTTKKPFIIAGWSLGGLLALRLASKGLADGLVLFGATACFVRPRQHSHLGWADAYLRQMIGGVRSDRQAVESRFVRNFNIVVEDGSFDDSRLTSGDWTEEALLAGLNVLRNEDCRPILPNIACPTLVVHGDADPICPFGAALELVEHMPNAELYTIEKCGHMPFLGREAEIAEAVRKRMVGL
jgi:pimeloyl-[acyl-carrier protein] methyl ester esterase